MVILLVGLLSLLPSPSASPPPPLLPAPFIFAFLVYCFPYKHRNFKMNNFVVHLESY